jgi:hypothetical protein
MSAFDAFDPVIHAWVARHGLVLETWDGRADARYVVINGRHSRVRVGVVNVPTLAVVVWNHADRQHRYVTTARALAQSLEEALAVARRWAQE